MEQFGRVGGPFEATSRRVEVTSLEQASSDGLVDEQRDRQDIDAFAGIDRCDNGGIGTVDIAHFVEQLGDGEMRPDELDPRVAPGADRRGLPSVRQGTGQVTGALQHRRTIEQRERQPLPVPRMTERIEGPPEVGGGAVGVAELEAKPGGPPRSAGGLDRCAP